MKSFRALVGVIGASLLVIVAVVLWRVATNEATDEVSNLLPASQAATADRSVPTVDTPAEVPPVPPTEPQVVGDPATQTPAVPSASAVALAQPLVDQPIQCQSIQIPAVLPETTFVRIIPPENGYAGIMSLLRDRLPLPQVELGDPFWHPPSQNNVKYFDVRDLPEACALAAISRVLFRSIGVQLDTETPVDGRRYYFEIWLPTE